jgi:hypothetical protein
MQMIEQPRDVTVRKSGNKAELAWNIRLSSRWSERYGAAQLFVDSEVLRLSEPYVPLLTGTLVRSGILGTDIGSGKVQWITPYAKRQYYLGRAPGESNTGPLRGRRWFDRMKEVHGAKIIAGAKKIAGGNE